MKAMAPLIALMALSVPAMGQTASESTSRQPPAGSAGGYVGEALFRAPLGQLPQGEALMAYTRDLLAPALPGLTLGPLSSANALAFRGEVPGLSGLTLRWWDQPGAGTASIQMSIFERDLNGGCVNDGILAQRGGTGTRVIAYTASCPAVNPPYQLLWLEAFDRERSRLLLVAAPSAGATALRGAGESLVTALGMSGAAGGAPATGEPLQPATPPGTASAAPPRPAASAPREVQTARGLTSDKPFAVSYPADLDQRSDGGSDFAVGDADQEFEATLTIRPATPSLSAEFDARAFGDGSGFLQMLRRSIPDAALVASAVLRLPAGPAHMVHWSAPATGSGPAMRYIDVSLYESGRQYSVSFAVRQSAFERRQDTIGFVLANLSTTSAPRPCCAEPVALP